jgi:DnaJ-class molecular chaperone
MAKIKRKKPCYTCRGNGALHRREWSPLIGWLDLSDVCPTCKGRKVV